MLFYQPPSGGVGKKKQKNELSGWSDREDWKLSGPMSGSKARSSRGTRRLRGPRVEVLSTTEAVRPLIHGPLLLKAHPLNNLYRTIALTCSLVLQGVCLPPNTSSSLHPLCPSSLWLGQIVFREDKTVQGSMWAIGFMSESRFRPVA